MMAAQTRTDGERIASLEGQMTHLATKADIENLRAELKTIKWILSIAIPAAIAITGIVVHLLNNLPG